MRSRVSLIETLRREPTPQVLIVGGGINGVGVMRDLAAQGVASLLVDRGDICGGTSAAPSRLIHGGLRYLETGEFGLVRESVQERELLLRNAPHLVRPIPTWVPLTSWTAGSITALGRLLRLVRKPGRKGAVPLKFGLTVYDRFAGATPTMPHHRFLSARKSRAVLPKLSQEVRIVAEYYDARIVHPERLTLELAADAERDCPGAAAIPYLSVAGRDGDRVLLRDECSGETIPIRPGLVVNVTGAWADGVDGTLGIAGRLIGGTKGSHLVLRAPDLAGQLGERMLYFETPDHRICLIYALDPDHVLLGTTDLATENPDDRACSMAEITYLLEVLEGVLPGHGLTPEAIVFSYAGVRPLPRSDSGVTGAISRDHRLVRFPSTEAQPMPVFTLVGGKWTTYRACAEEIADTVLAELGLTRRQKTTHLPIGGGAGWPAGGAEALAADLAKTHGIPPARATILIRRYGTVAANFLGDETPLATAPTYSRGEITCLAQEERVTHLEDIILRRSLLAFEGLNSRACIEEVARIVAATLGWSDATRHQETDATCTLLDRQHSVPGQPTRLVTPP
jgi:glycerol-3-phosphate dehydrogenase